MNDHIFQVVLADNPWLEGASLEDWYARHLPSNYIPRRISLEPSEKVCLVVGPRQAGKSTLVWKHLTESGSPVLFLNCEEPAIREWLTSPAMFVADLKSLNEKIPALFLEEVQRLKEAGLILKGVVDRRPEVPIFATGSSSFELQARTRESLAGRASRHLLLPFSLEEVTATLHGPSMLKQKRLKEELERMLIFGGYPTVLTAKDPGREVASLVEAFVIRDASDRFRITNIPALRKLLELMAGQIGNLVNFSEWAAIAGISNDTVADYVSLLEETHVVRLVRPFIGGKRAEVTKARKVYFIDNGVRNRLFGGFFLTQGRADFGALLENLVFSEVHKAIDPLLDSVKYWRSKSGAEVDFVIEHQGRLAVIEVKSGAAGFSRSLYSFLQAYEPTVMFLVGLERPRHPMDGFGRTLIKWVLPWEIGPEVRSFSGVDGEI